MKVTICKGLPASGKTTWAKEQVYYGKGKIKRINKDDLRAMLDDSLFSKENELFIKKIQHEILWHCLNENLDVIIDDTNLNTNVTNDHIEFIEKYKKITGNYDITIEIKEFNVSLEECLTRNYSRKNRVPDEVIQNMYNKYFKN